VLVTEIGASTYRASGCGKIAEYECHALTTNDEGRSCREMGMSPRGARPDDDRPERPAPINAVPPPH
jgi:hypothetical protein